MKIAVVLNEAAGTLVGEPIASVGANVDRWFAAAGAAARVTWTPGAWIRDEIERALDSGCEALVVGGGDGTILTAAEALVGRDCPALGVLPLGTMNLLARDLGMPLDLPAAVRALAHGSIRAIDVAEVNGRLFLNNSVMGLYPSLVRARERQRGVRGLRKWLALGSAVYKAFHYYNLIRVTVDLGGGPRRIKTPALAVANNVYQDHGVGLLDRHTLEEGVLAVYVARHRTRIGLIRLMAGLVLGGWTRDAELESVTMTELVVKSRRRRITVANDGEVLKLVPPLVYRIRPQALRVLVPATAAPPGECRL